MGLVKKAIELAVLCDSQVLLVCFGPGSSFQYCSAEDPDQFLRELQGYSGAMEQYSTEDVGTLDDALY